MEHSPIAIDINVCHESYPILFILSQSEMVL